MDRTFPYLEVSGTHTDLGTAIGERFQEAIQERIKIRQEKIPNYVSYLERIEPYFSATKKAFPQLIEELTAIAKAANVPLADYFFHNCRELFFFYLPGDIAWLENVEKGDKPEDHCTIVFSPNSENPITGHNEDWSKEALDDLYVLKATVNGITFLGLAYNTVIPGDSAMMNNFGLIQCINELHPHSQIGVPKNFIARAVLECKSLDEAERLIANTKRASGYNHVLSQGNEVRNIEIAGEEMVAEKIIGLPFIHTNHYTSPRLKHLEKYHTVSSEKRYDRAKELVKPDMTKEEVISVLSDTKDSKYPICSLEDTVGSVVFVPSKDEVRICYGPPCAGEFVKYSL